MTHIRSEHLVERRIRGALEPVDAAVADETRDLLILDATSDPGALARVATDGNGFDHAVRSACSVSRAVSPSRAATEVRRGQRAHRAPVDESRAPARAGWRSRFRRVACSATGRGLPRPEVRPSWGQRRDPTASDAVRRVLQGQCAGTRSRVREGRVSGATPRGWNRLDRGRHGPRNGRALPWPRAGREPRRRPRRSRRRRRRLTRWALCRANDRVHDSAGRHRARGPRREEARTGRRGSSSGAA